MCASHAAPAFCSTASPQAKTFVSVYRRVVWLQHCGGNDVVGGENTAVAAAGAWHERRDVKRATQRRYIIGIM